MAPKGSWKYQKVGIPSKNDKISIKPKDGMKSNISENKPSDLPSYNTMKVEESLKNAKFNIPPINIMLETIQNLHLDYFCVEMVIYNMIIQDDQSKTLESSLFNNLSNIRVKKIQEEKENIKKISSISEFMTFINLFDLDSMAERQLREKSLQFQNELVPLLLTNLISNRIDRILERTIHVLYEIWSHFQINFEKEIQNAIELMPTMYSVSLLCVLLGIMKCTGSISLIWKTLHYLLSIDSKYYQGPLLALQLIIEG